VGTPVRDSGYKARRPARHGPDGHPGGTLSEETTGATVGRRVRRPYPKRADGRRRLSGPAIISIVLHVIVGIALLRILLVPYPFTSLFASKEKPVEPERISFLALPQASTTTSPGKSGGNGRSEAPKRETPRPLVAPTEVPSTLPPVTPAAPPPTTEDEANGPLIGRGGATRGIRPSYSDPRIWVPPAPVVSAPKSAHERMDSVVTADIEHARDSAAAVAYSPNKFERGDWTVEKNGKKYGIDNQYIRLGKVSIPNVLLGLLPLNMQGNPIAAQRDRATESLRQEILYQSQRAMNEEQFRKAVKELRERKEREHQQQEKDRAPKPISAVDRDRGSSSNP
jgi:hypothetical protein